MKTKREKLGGEMKDYLKRLIDEHKDLNEKISKLYDFLNSEKFSDVSEEEQVLLDSQYHAMQTYGFIIAERIKHHFENGDIDISEVEENA